MIYIFLVSTGVICNICLQVSGHCTSPECKGSSEEIDEILVTTSVMMSIGKRRNGQYSTSSCKDPKTCPSGFDFLPEADGCFKVIFQSLNWSEASEVCRGIMPGVHLVAITSAAKQEAIENYLEGEFNKTESSVCLRTALKRTPGKSVWIGGQRQNSTSCDTDFVWKTLDSIEIPFNYSNWKAEEPNCYDDNEHCVHVASGIDYKWNDRICHLPFCALCEF